MRLHCIESEPSQLARDACDQFEFVAHAVKATLELYQRKGFVPPWVGYLAEEETRIVGGCGFAGPPVNGEAEIAYFTLPGNENKGIATRMATELMRIARQTSGSEIFIAHTLPFEGPSTSVLKKLGFECLGIIDHPEDGQIWKWQVTRRS